MPDVWLHNTAQVIKTVQYISAIAKMSSALGSRYSEVKKGLVSPVYEERVKHSWQRLLNNIECELSEITEAGPNYIPEVQWNELNEHRCLPSDKEAMFKKRGCIIVRGVVSEETALNWKSQLISYVTAHSELGGSPRSNPTNWWVHWSKAQTEARSHPNIMKMYRILGKVWKVKDEALPIDMESSVVYADRFRIRYPGKDYALRLHLDSGSIERWEDNGYRDVYREIFQGDWESWDPWLIDRRLYANQDLYKLKSANGSTCSTLRTYQGWLSLSDTKAGEGTIRFLPNLSLTIPYIMLRPLFDQNGDLVTNDSRFPGATPGSGQFFPSEKYYPHLFQANSVIGIPYVKPGDFVVWHSDLCHEVDMYHNGTTDSSVMYIAHNPLCEYNIETLLDTRGSFEAGTKPKDFAYEYETNPACESSFEDRSQPDDVLTLEGKEALGISPYRTDLGSLSIGQKKIRNIANQVLAETPPKINPPFTTASANFSTNSGCKMN